MTSGALTLFAVALYSGLTPIRRVWGHIRAALAQLNTPMQAP